VKSGELSAFVFRAAVAAVYLSLCLMILQRECFEHDTAILAIELCTCSSPECRPCGHSSALAPVAFAVRRYAQGLEYAVSDDNTEV